MLAIIDYGLGNLTSVRNAFEQLNVEAQVVPTPGALEDADAIVLPGVGAFGDGMRVLHERGFVPALEREVRQREKPFLGLCLGQQLLATRGFEHGEHAGLGWIPGDVVRLEAPPEEPGLRIPHMGWNDVEIRRADGLYRELDGVPSFYFVHSYVLRPIDPSVISGVTVHGGPFAASVECGNVFATQYHPEKSQQAGAMVLQNFLRLAGLEAATA